MNQKERIGEAQKLFNLLYRGVTSTKYGYLWTFPAKKTYSFDVLNAESRLKMAEKAIWLNDELEQNVFFGVVLTDTKLDEYHRVSIKGEYPPVLQPAIWADLDIKGENHKADNLPPDAETAISLLPFKASIVVNSGGGLHAYNLLDTPFLLNTYEERKNANKRNTDYLDMIRANGEGKYKIDGTADLPRVLRVPGTYNLKNIENPVLCHIVEINESVRYSLNELNHLIIPPPKLSESSKEITSASNKIFDDNNYQWARAVRMLDFINADDYDEWIKAGTNIKQVALNLGIAESKAFEAFKHYSAKSAKFDLDECLDKWEELPNGDSDSIKTLFRTAERGGYDEKSFYKEWNDTQIAVGNERYKELRADNMKKSAQNELDDDFILGDSEADYDENGYDEESTEFKKYLSKRKTGFEEFDKKQKLAPGLIIIGAESGIGKTTFCHQLVEQIVKNNPDEIGIYISYEMSKLEIHAKTLTRRTKLASDEAKAKGESFDIPITDFQARCGGTNGTVKKVREELKKQKLNLRIYEATPKDNVEVLLKKLKKSIDNIKRKNPAILSPIVVVDYLQILPHDKDNHKLGIDGIVLRLKEFQRETKTTFIVISSVNRSSYKDKDKDMSAFKEAGSIEFGADVALIINRKDDNTSPSHLNLKCLKNRFGRIKYNIDFDFYGEYDLFVENGAAQQANSNDYNDIDDWDAEAEEENRKNG